MKDLELPQLLDEFDRLREGALSEHKFNMRRAGLRREVLERIRGRDKIILLLLAELKLDSYSRNGIHVEVIETLAGQVPFIELEGERLL